VAIGDIAHTALGAPGMAPIRIAALATGEGAIQRRRGQTLDVEAVRLAAISHRLGRRLSAALRQLTADRELPDEAWRETYQLYSGVILRLLAEQTQRAKIYARAGSPPQMSDEEYQSELRAIAHEQVRALSDEEFEALAAERRAKAAPVDVVEVVCTVESTTPSGTLTEFFNYGKATDGDS
jgi:hypothetical protein